MSIGVYVGQPKRPHSSCFAAAAPPPPALSPQLEVLKSKVAPPSVRNVARGWGLLDADAAQGAQSRQVRLQGELGERLLRHRPLRLPPARHGVRGRLWVRRLRPRVREPADRRRGGAEAAGEAAAGEEAKGRRVRGSPPPHPPPRLALPSRTSTAVQSAETSVVRAGGRAFTRRAVDNSGEGRPRGSRCGDGAEHFDRVGPA